MKKTITFITLFALLLTATLFSTNAVADSKVNIRIEGVTETLFQDTISMEITDTTSVADALTIADKNSDSLTIVGIENGYITEVNGETSGKFGGWDGWLYAVNGSAPEVGISSCPVKDGDSIVLYYGDYPCQYPRVNLAKSYSGVLKFESYDTTYDENWNPTYSWEPIADATVTVGDSKYTTDSNGIVTVDTSKLSYFNNVQIERKSSSNAPNVCRLDSSFGFYFNDINQDGKVNINDATRLQKHIVNKENLNAEGLSVSDVNLDGEINVRDVTTLQKILAEIADYE